MNMAVEESAASVGERCNSRSILDDQSVREVVRSRSWQGTLGLEVGLNLATGLGS